MNKLVRHFELQARVPLTKSEFLTFPKGSIAIDGYLPEGPWLDLETLHGNINHHENVDRLATRCSAAQATIGVRMGRFEAFFKQGIHCYMNDCDPDVAMTLWVLENPARVRTTLNPIFNKVLHLLDMLDTTGATYPFPLDFDLGEYHWIFEPYFSAQQQGIVEQKNPIVYEQIVDDCHARLEQYLVGKQGHIDINTTFTTLGVYPKWGMFETHGSLARMGIVAAGHYAFVLVRPRLEGYTYTIQRTSDGVNFPVPKILAALTLREDGVESWGGGDTIGGSPRIAGSKLTPTQVAETINQVLES